jgi:hypothetical protein
MRQLPAQGGGIVQYAAGVCQFIHLPTVTPIPGTAGHRDGGRNPA